MEAMDVRKYRRAIISAVKKVSGEDNNWNWHYEGISHAQAKIRWGYLYYIGETRPFMIAMEMDDSPVVIGTMPNGNKIYRFVGSTIWDDCETVEEAIQSVLAKMAEKIRKIS